MPKKLNHGPRSQSNGHVSPSLHMDGAQRSRPMRASLNVAMARLPDDGSAQAVCTLYDDVCQRLREHGTPLSLDVDDFHPPLLAEKVKQQLDGSVDLEEVTSDQEGLHKRHQVHRELRNARPTRLHQSLQRFATDEATRIADRFRNTFGETIDEDFCSAAEHASQARLLLNSLQFTAPDFQSFRRVTALFDGLAALRGDTKLPAAKREAFAERLRQACPLLLEAEGEAVALQIAVDAIQSAVDDIHPLIDDAQQQGAAARRRLTDVQALLRSAAESQQSSQIYSSSSIYVQLPGKAPAEHIVAAKSHLQADDSAQLAMANLQRWQQRLQEVATQRYPHISADAPLNKFLSQMRTIDTATAFDLVARSAFQEHYSVYTAVQEQGIEAVARELIERSEAPINLGGRDRIALQVEPQQLTLVIDPPPRNASDARIRAEFHDACSRLSTGCRMIDAAPQSNDIVVCRLLAGFPAVILADNEYLLPIYARASEMNHPPHLVGVMPGTSGEPLPRLVSAALTKRPRS